MIVVKFFWFMVVIHYQDVVCLSFSGDFKMEYYMHIWKGLSVLRQISTDAS